MKKISLLFILLVPFILSGCSSVNSSSDIDKQLLQNKPRGDASQVNDIASQPNQVPPTAEENVKINNENLRLQKDTQAPSDDKQADQTKVDGQSNSAVSTSPVAQATVTELKIEDLKVGTGAQAVNGKKITVNYKGTLLNGIKFDSSYDRNQPFSFNLGAGEVIKGWDLGFEGMKVGGKRRLTIPADMAYGSRDMGVIPPNSPLIFEVELLGVE